MASAPDRMDLQQRLFSAFDKVSAAHSELSKLYKDLQYTMPELLNHLGADDHTRPIFQGIRSLPVQSASSLLPALSSHPTNSSALTARKDNQQSAPSKSHAPAKSASATSSAPQPTQSETQQPLSSEEMSSHEHLAQQYLAASSASRRRKRDPNAPKQPLSAYQRFRTVIQSLVREDLGQDASRGDISTEILKRWKDLSDEEKQPYVDEYTKDKEMYDVAKEEYDRGPSENQQQLSAESSSDEAEAPVAQPLTISGPTQFLPQSVAATPAPSKSPAKAASTSKLPAASTSIATTPAPSRTPANAATSGSNKAPASYLKTPAKSLTSKETAKTPATVDRNSSTTTPSQTLPAPAAEQDNQSSSKHSTKNKSSTPLEKSEKKKRKKRDRKMESSGLVD